MEVSAPTEPVAETRKAIFSVRHASQIYRMGEVDVMALRDANLDLLEGELLVIVGPSGSGKSTLLNLIGGMNRPTTGKILFDGRDMTNASDRELTRFRRDSVGFVFQFYNLVPTLTALENVQVATEVCDHAMEPIEALRLVGLANRSDHFPSQMSGGEQQRVSIARAIAKNPRLMLCDEPTGALDIETGKSILSLLCRMRDELGQTIAIITHNHEIALIGDRVATLKDGVIDSLRVNETRLSPEEIKW